MNRIKQITAAVILCCVAATAKEDISKKVYAVPNFHPASCGWLTDWSTERSFCANSYFDHLDRVRDDENYSFCISEVNNMIAMKNFRPERFEELKKRLKEGRVEAVNAFFLEPAITLSGGEALVRQGIEGMRWQKNILEVEPRLSWMIDVTSTHEQMGQIVDGLGLEGLVQCRFTQDGSTTGWMESPDGTRTIGIATGIYSGFRQIFRTETELPAKDVQALVDFARKRKQSGYMPMVGNQAMQAPDGLPFLVLSGSGDYSLAPLYKDYPTRFLEQWKEAAPDLDLQFTTMSPYLDEALPLIQSGKVDIPVVKGGWPFAWNSFWIQNAKVKTRFRRSEHDLQAAEMLSSIASLKSAFEYPSQDLNHAWLLMMLNMDRNTLWGAAAGVVFEDAVSWDANDRFNWTDETAGEISGQAVGSLLGKGKQVALFNPLNWKRESPIALDLPAGKQLTGIVSQPLPNGTVLCQPELPPVGIAAFSQEEGAGAVKAIDLPETIETEHYLIQLDPKKGDLVSLKQKSSGREFLGGPANVLAAEKAKGFGDQMQFRPDRQLAEKSNQHDAEIKVTTGPLATIVEVTSTFYGGKPAIRTMCFYNDYPRIDFDTWIEDIPDRTVIISEFPLAEDVSEIRRGIPYGFSHGWWNEKQDDLHGKVDGITPAVRWSHYTLKNGGGFALIDEGLSGREITGNTPTIFLTAANATYHDHPCQWLSGKGKQHYRYSIVAHDSAWDEVNIPRMAWEFNSKPVRVNDVEESKALSFVTTSDNLIIQSIRRDGSEIELRMMESLGRPGKGTVKINLPHKKAEFTNMVGKNRQKVDGKGSYTFDVRPQQIITLRLAADDRVADVESITDWSPFVPEHKLEALHKYIPDVKGHTGRSRKRIVLSKENAVIEGNQKLDGAVQYVRISIPGQTTTLSLAEVEVISNKRNVAQNAVATQSSVDKQGGPELAVDGNNQSDFHSGSVTLTTTEKDPWWELDLGKEMPVEKLVIWNRTEAFPERIIGAKIELLDKDKKPLWTKTVSEEKIGYQYSF